MENLHGIIPPVPTLFHESRQMDEKGMGELIDFLISAGVNGLFFLGTSGEFSQMTFEERKKAAEFAISYVNKRVPVLIGTGSPNTHETIILSQHAEEAGADAIVVINPYYWPLSEDHLLEHYSEIAESVKMPVLLYNFPALTGQDLTPDFVKKLVEKHTNIIGIKETTDQAGHIREMILTVKNSRPDFKVFCGFDDHLLNTLSLGGDGAIAGSTNFAPSLTVGIYQSFRESQFDRALELHQRLSAIPAIYKIDSPFVNVIKEAIKLCGLEVSTYVLPPARPLREEKKAALEKLLREVELI